MRKFYQAVLLTGIATVAITSGAMAAGETHLGKAYDKVVAANTSIQTQKADEAIKALKSAKWELRKNDLLNKNKDEVAKDKEIRTNIDSVVAMLKEKTPDMSKAGSETQKIQDAVQTEMNAHPAAPEAAPAAAPAAPAMTPAKQ